MIAFIRDLRLIPIAVVACACLLALKAADLLLEDNSSAAGGAPNAVTSVIRTTPDMPQPSGTVLSWATQMFNFPNGSGTTGAGPVVESLPADRFNPDITGTVSPPPADKAGAPAPAASASPPPETKPAGALDQPGPASGAERAILERLSERRQELDARARELDIRESLIKAAETRMEGQLTALKETEQRITSETEQKDDANAARFKGLVTMYENMKPRDAAKIFDRLEIGVLIAVASKIDPRHMADIMAQMSPDMAERLTVELASKAQQVKQSGSPSDLPKIQGQPATP